MVTALLCAIISHTIMCNESIGKAADLLNTYEKTAKD